MIGNLNAGNPWLGNLGNLTVAPNVPSSFPEFNWDSGMGDFLSSQGYGGYGGFGSGINLGNLSLGSGGGGGFGNLLSNIFSPSKWTSSGVGMAGDILGGLGSLSNIYFGAKNYGLTKDMLDFQKKLSQANFENQAALMQNQADRGRLYRRALGGVKGEPRTVLRSKV